MKLAKNAFGLATALSLLALTGVMIANAVPTEEQKAERARRRAWSICHHHRELQRFVLIDAQGPTDDPFNYVGVCSPSFRGTRQ